MKEKSKEEVKNAKKKAKESVDIAKKKAELEIKSEKEKFKKEAEENKAEKGKVETKLQEKNDRLMIMTVIMSLAAQSAATICLCSRPMEPGEAILAGTHCRLAKCSECIRSAALGGGQD